jgi:acyl-CoA reductase-like NAD-dependent aldehyde dehydrogenase
VNTQSARFSPGDLSHRLPNVAATPTEPAIAAAVAAVPLWTRTPLSERAAMLRNAQTALSGEKETLARGIALETGKPITEARAELGAVLAKFDLTIADAEHHLAVRDVTGGPHPAFVRRRPRGPAAIIAPFNFPLHLGNGALLAHLAAGNPVIFKPSPFAATVAAAYSAIMQRALPPGVFGLVQGGGEEGQTLCLDPRVRAVCLTGSVPVGRALAKALADDFSKELALEMGGRNASLICGDADLDLAARAVADAICLTCGQRCNSTARILVDRGVANDFTSLLVHHLARYIPGDPLRDGTKLGPLVSAAAVERYTALIAAPGDWLVAGAVPGEADGKRGHYVCPAVHRGPLANDAECFVPVAECVEFDDLDQAVALHNDTLFGLTVSVFTRDRNRFARLADELRAGNIYANLPTTFSPSTLPFGGWGLSGNGRPAGQGFIRFCTQEQALQIGSEGFS